MGHSIVNAAGNASSTASATSAKQKLYQNSSTRTTLENGLLTDLLYTFSECIELINERKGIYIHSVFNIEKSNTLFENAKKFPDKQCELLFQAFKWCPWNTNLIKYIFTNFPDERKTICDAARRFNIDLTDSLEKILSKEYTQEARYSEKEAQQAKSRILLLMQEYGITDSPTLDQLEQDCIARLCNGLESADEATCNSYISAINNYDAQEKNKAPFLERLHNRIDEIWSAEDSAIFNRLYFNTNLKVPSEVENTLQYIKSKGRTSSAEKYIKALEGATEKNIKKARLYRKRTESMKLFL